MDDLKRRARSLSVASTREPRHHPVQLPEFDVMIIDPLLGQVDGGVIIGAIDFDLADQTAGTRNDIKAVVLQRSSPS